ncbi:MAG TPA: hypothetical protein PLH98_06095 [Ruminococcus flavefaciens]|nr:hypothetical protein [Ruminococcus flavefaciens]
MYKLSEQPASRIISEMPDFSFLNDTYVFTVKERFNIYDEFYEVGDLVAISGANKTAISILPYETLKKCRSDCFMSCVDRKGSVLEISLEDFRRRFELSEAETEKVESITNNIKPIRSQKSAEIHELGYDEPDVDLILLYIIAFMIASFFIWLSVKLHCEVGVAVTVAFNLYIVGCIVLIISGKIKYNALETKYQKLYDEIDKKRAKNGMYLKEL